MSYDARMVSSITPPSLFRVVDEYGSSLTVDEADNVFRDEKSDLLGIMNAGRDRMTARVMRAEAVGDGKFKVREFNTFAPIALTSIKQLPNTLQDRAITLPLKRATQSERPERLTLRTRGPLIDIGRRLTRWAVDLKELPDPHMPAACSTGSRTSGSSSFRSPRRPAASGQRGAARPPWQILRAKKQMTLTVVGTPICLPTCGRSSTRPARRRYTPTNSAKNSSRWTSRHGALRTAAIR
jgi:hypothetical protein